MNLTMSRIRNRPTKQKRSAPKAMVFKSCSNSLLSAYCNQNHYNTIFTKPIRNSVENSSSNTVTTAAACFFFYIKRASVNYIILRTNHSFYHVSFIHACAVVVMNKDMTYVQNCRTLEYTIFEWNSFSMFNSPVSRRISRRPPAEKNFRLSRRWFC